MADSAELEPWIDALCDCAARVVPRAGFGAYSLLTRAAAPAADLSGAAITLLREAPVATLGVLSDPSGRCAIARVLFQMGASEQPNANDEVDAIGELTNMISGQVNATMSLRDGRMRIGLPTPADATTFPETPRQLTLHVTFGDVRAALVLTLL